MCIIYMHVNCSLGYVMEGIYIYIMILYIISYIYIIESLNSIAKAAVDSFEDVSEHSEGTYFNDCLA